MSDDLHDLGEALVRATTRTVRWLPTEGVEHSLSAIRMMARLADQGASRITDLAKLERTSQPTITNHIKRLERLGFITRSGDPRDARVVLVELNADGHRELLAIRRRLGTNLEPHLARLNARERRTLEAGLAVMAQLTTMH